MNIVLYYVKMYFYFLSQICQDLNEEAVRSYFSTFGEIKKINLVMDKVTKRSKGFCFIVFSNEISAVAACMNNTHYIKERRVDVKKAISNTKTPVLAYPHFGIQI